MTAQRVWIEPGRADRYAVAVAELPLRTRLTDGIDGAIAVVGTSQGLRLVLRAAPAAVVLVADAAVDALLLDDPALDELSQRVPAIPVIVDRRLLRPDVVAAAATPATAGRDASAPRYVTLDLIAPAGDRDSALADALGWGRVLAAGPLTAVSTSDARPGAPERAGARSIALLDARPTAGASPAGVVLSVILRSAQARGVQLRATSVDDHRVDVVIDERAGVVRVTRTTEDGVLVAPISGETRERLALRRAVGALSDGALVTDLDELRADAGAAKSVRDGSAAKGATT